MWRLKNFMPKEQNGLEGRIIDIGNLKIQIRNIIAEGGFSIVYLTRDMIHGSKQYALKHIICNDEESLDLVKKEISVMKSLMGHTNIVKLYAHKFFDMGRTKEAFLVMEYCESSLVNVLESRGATYFEEKQILAIFRDACNAVFAMHCFSPPIAHRDLKAENLLLGSDGEWKLCDFGSTSTNHKRFEKPAEMGIEEDNIRKHTTPAYRAPEMWDLYRRELINERVDIWALGCLLFRICYFKSAFDGESKLQILNGNYRIPDSPKYSAALTDLIRDMLQSSPDARPDISQKSLPDRPPEVQKQGTGMTGGGVPMHSTKNCPMPRRSLPHPPFNAEPAQNESPASSNSRADVGGGPLGAFWSTHYAKDSGTEDKINPKFDEEPITHGLSARDRSPQDRFPISLKTSSPKKDMAHTHSVPKNVHEKSLNKKDINHSKDFEIIFFQEEPGHQTERPKAPKQESTTNSQNDAFNAFVTEFRMNKLSSETKTRKTGNEEMLDSEVERLKEQLKQSNLEKAEISSKYEKLSAISRSQRQEIQELKQALTGKTPSPNTDASKNQMLSRSQLSTSPVQQAKADGTVLEPQKGLSDKGSPSPDAKPWKPFADDPIQQKTPPSSNNPRSVRTRNISQNKQAAEENLSGNAWGFGTDSFTAVPATSSQVSKSFNEFNSSSQHFSGSRNKNSKATSQPAGWSGF